MLQTTIGVLVGAGLTTAVVQADGGDQAKVHACTLDNVVDGANVRIVGADEACPEGSTPVHWNVQGPQGPAGPAGAQGPAGPAGQNADVRKVLEALAFTGLPDGLFKTVRKRSRKDRSSVKFLAVRCPDTHPTFVSASALARPRIRSKRGVTLIDELPVPTGGENGAYFARYERVTFPKAKRKRWRATAIVICLKGG